MKNLKLLVIQNQFGQPKQHPRRNTKVNSSKIQYSILSKCIILFFYSVKLSNPLSKYMGEDYCLVETDPKQSHNYLIYKKNDQSNTKILFGQLFSKICGYNNYLYKIIIGQKLYKVQSCDLKDRRLAIVDAIQSNNSSTENPYSTSNYPDMLFQVIDSFSKSNKKYHVNINDKEWQLGYLAITILLHLHECKRDTD